MPVSLRVQLSLEVEKMPREEIAELLKQLRDEAEEALKENPSPEIRERLERILKMVNSEIGPTKH